MLLLEGAPLSISAPKSHFAKDILFDKDTPVFCTSKSENMSVKNGVVDFIKYDGEYSPFTQKYQNQSKSTSTHVENVTLTLYLDK